MTNFLISALLATIAGSARAQRLESYDVDPKLVSVSGLSSGGFMAGQLGVAYSGIFQTGFGVFAGGPFDCARDQYVQNFPSSLRNQTNSILQVSNCIANAVPSIESSISHMRYWSGKEIDTLDNLQNRKIYLEVGTADPTVGLGPMRKLRDQLAYFSDSTKMSFVTTLGAGHTFPTNFDAPGNAPCKVGSQSPFISNCGYDGAGEALQWMYGPLNARSNGTAAGQLFTFNQTDGFGAPGMAPTGYVYVPSNCQNKSTTCKLHVVLHGCRQDPGRLGTTFISNTGYLNWAGECAILVALYTQV